MIKELEYIDRLISMLDEIKAHLETAAYERVLSYALDYHTNATPVPQLPIPDEPSLSDQAATLIMEALAIVPESNPAAQHLITTLSAKSKYSAEQISHAIEHLREGNKAFDMRPILLPDNKAECPICHEVKDRRGIGTHIRIKHREYFV